MKKIMKSLFLICILMLCMSTSVLAATRLDLQASSSGQSFTKAWQATKYGTYSQLTYGYNTSWINEDYAWAYHSGADHQASLTNSNGTYKSVFKHPGEKASIEVTHSGSSIYYYSYSSSTE